jgi:hypothetical protein
VKTLSRIQKSVLAAITVAAFARPAAAASPVAGFTMSAQVAPVAVFVSDGARSFLAATVNAPVQLLDDGSFLIRCGSLPAIPGRWANVQSPNAGTVLCLWAKTDQIDFNATQIGADAGGDLLMLYSVQVNAPRTDGAPDPNAPGPLPPASLQAVQVWSSGTANGTVSGTKR